MAFCVNCGSKLNEGSKFCSSCGSSVENYSESKNYATSANYGSQLTENPTIANSGINSNAVNYAIKNNNLQGFFNSKQGKIVIAAIASVVVVVIMIFCWLQFGAHSNRNISIPKASALNSAPLQKTVDNLRKQGLNVTVSKEFSSVKRGGFVRFANAHPGQSVPSSSHITVIESNGPGIPKKGVVGQSIEKAKKVANSMGVPVEVYNIISTNTGKVVATDPMPGFPVSNGSSDKSVIRLAVGVEGKGVPADLFGMDKDEAVNKLRDLGLKDVSLHPHFSSEKNLGKIIASNPALGTKFSGGHIDLYYGVDASETKNIMTMNSPDDNSVRWATNTAPAMFGTWCTNDGDCMELQTHYYPKTNPIFTFLQFPDDPVDSNDSRFYEYLALCNYSQDPGACTLPHDYESGREDRMKNHLLSGDTGAFELYRGMGLPYCGETTNDNIGNICVNGKWVDSFEPTEDIKQYGSPDKIPGYWKGSSFRMRDFFLLVPVHANLNKIESSGYFEGKGNKKPDTTRPFILRRNPKLYTQTTVDAEPYKGDIGDNPFVPTNKHKAVPFKPAPDDSVAYYLVEKPFDWSKLPERD